jgi:ribosomal protein L7Ae-like RNA K-turn-binding protein
MKNKIFNTAALVLCVALCVQVQAQKDSTAKPQRQSLIYLQYHVKNNKVPYLYVQTKNKLDNAFLPVGNVSVAIYLNKDLAADALIGKVTTNENGVGSIGIPGNLASNWNGAASHTFYAHADSSANFGPAEKSVNATIARLVLDTLTKDTTKNVVVKLEKKEGSAWVPVKDVDVRVGVKRLGGYLNVADKDSYTTDSTGHAEAEFAQQKLPGDAKGNVELVALIDDNDEVGTMETSVVVPWGVAPIYKSEFGERSLWATPRRAPIWLMLMAYGCIITVWSMIIYLITRIILIRKLGKQTAR